MVLAVIGVFAEAKVFGQKTIWKVEYSGAMREMFETGDISGKTDLSKLKPQKHLYGVGPLENLSGEIMVWDGKPLISFVKDKVVKVDADPNAKAVFFVWARVAKWREMPVPADIKTYEQLEKFVADSAESIGLSSAEPFPFLLKGVFRSVEIHINDYRSDGAKLTREKHDALKYRSKLENSSLDMLGFYSNKHQGVFTHHTRTSHIHATDKDRTTIGHVDDLILGGKVRLFLPVE